MRVEGQMWNVCYSAFAYSSVLCSVHVLLPTTGLARGMRGNNKKTRTTSKAYASISLLKGANVPHGPRTSFEGFC